MQRRRFYEPIYPMIQGLFDEQEKQRAMASKNPQQVAQKWLNNLSNATQSVIDGVNAVTESPTAKAAQAADKYVSGIQRAVQSGKWQSGLNRVSLQDWKRAMLTKGAARITQGASESLPKMQAFLSEFLPYVEQVRAEIQRMPNATLEQNIQRAIANIRRLSEFKRKK